MHIVVDPRDRGAVDNAERDGEKRIYLKRLPLGFWVRMEKYVGAPFTTHLPDHSSTLLPADT